MPVVDPIPHSFSSPAAPVVGLGTLLRRAREQRGLTLDQVAAETKIPVHRLVELERDDPAGAERGFYERAQIRAYARAVKLGEHIVHAELERDTAAPEPAPAREEPKIRRPSVRPHHMVMVMVCAAVLGLLGRATWRSPSADSAHVSPSASEGSHDETRQVAAIGKNGTSPTRSNGESTDVTPASATEEAQARHTPAVVQASQSSVDDSAQELEAAPVSTPSPGVTELVVTTLPADARVTVNGVGWGATPITIRHLSPGSKRIRVTKDGYLAGERVVGVAADRSTSLTIQLQPAP